MLALEGINVLDLSLEQGGMSPSAFCTMILGDLGAEVIKIGAPATADQRQVSTSRLDAERRRALYQAIDRNKKSVVLNLKSEKGRQVFYQLAERADVIVEGFRPGVVKRLGVDYPTVTKINPKIIYCSVTAYGQGGPYRKLPGHNVNIISFGAALDLTGEKDGRPILPLNVIADLGGGGMNAAIGILSALVARDKTGKGQYVDISLMDAIITLMPRLKSHYFQYGEIPKRGETLYGGAYPYCSIYRTKDSKFIAIGCAEPMLWENLCRAIGKEEFIPFHYEPEHFYQPPQDRKWEEISSYLKQLFLTKTRDEWFELLSKRDIPIAKVYSLDELFADPQVIHRGMVVEVEHPTEGKIKQIGIAIKLSDTPGKVRSLAPALGEHTEEVLKALGYNKHKISELRQEGVIN